MIKTLDSQFPRLYNIPREVQNDIPPERGSGSGEILAPTLHDTAQNRRILEQKKHAISHRMYVGSNDSKVRPNQALLGFGSKDDQIIIHENALRVQQHNTTFLNSWFLLLHIIMTACTLS